MCINLNVVKLIIGKKPWLRQVIVLQISFFYIVWIHNDSMYVRFDGIRNKNTGASLDDLIINAILD